MNPKREGLGEIHDGNQFFQYRYATVDVAREIDTIASFEEFDKFYTYDLMDGNSLLEVKERALREDNYILNPLASIPEMNLDIYSRCIVCRMNADGVFKSLNEGDYEIWGRYLAY